MFRIHDHELREVELALFQTTALVEKDGFVFLPGQSKRNERSAFNVAELLLEWSTGEEFGVQRIRLGVHKPLTRPKWKRKLFAKSKRYPEGLQGAVIHFRKISVRACFPTEAVRFRFLGWRLLRLEFWTPGTAIRIPEAKEAVTKAVLVEPCFDKSMFRRGAKLQ